jgi:hypothetical protein
VGAVLGRIAVYSFLIALVSGILLLPFFQSSMTPVVYHGSYRELDGLTVSRAYQSTLNISFDVRGGLLIRQVHHWSGCSASSCWPARCSRSRWRGRSATRWKHAAATRPSTASRPAGSR